VQKQCLRCGLVWEINSTRKNPDYCASCRARKQVKIGECLVWQGNYAEDLITPINEEGLPVVAGESICGNSDCVNPEHRKMKK